MKFSIITCTYNSEVWLKKNIYSVNNQSYSDWEHIFIDGFSSDGTLSIIKDYQNLFPEKVKLFQFPPKGISNAMNEGVKKTNGDFLIHLHADDGFYDANVLRDVNRFLSSSDFDWIYGKINVVDGGGENQGIFPTKKIWQNNYHNRLGKYLLKFYNYIPHQAVFIKKEVFDKFGYFDENLVSAMDPDLWFRIKNKTKWSFYDRIVSNFCMHSESQTANLKMKEKNKLNYSIVQRRYLNLLELFLTRIVNQTVNTRAKKLNKKLLNK